jgi:two-component system NtrC family sensor kinase
VSPSSPASSPDNAPPPFSPLRGRDEHYRFLIENCSDIVFSLDEEGVITFISPQVRRYGYNPQAMIRTHFLDYIHPADRKRMFTAFLRSPTQGRDGAVDFRLLDSEGAGIPMEEKGQAILSESGEFQGLSGVLRDITERKQAEEALLRTERLMGVDYLAGGIAHQFNNIHAGLIGYLDLLALQDDLSKRSKRFVSHIQRATERAMEVTHNMAAFARLKRSRKGTVGLNQILESTLPLVREELENEGITLTVSLEEEMPPIQAHAGEISQVILNLLINAHHSLLGCPKQEIHVETRKKPGMAQVTLRDTGCGIAPRDLNRIFMPFYSTKGEYSGTHSTNADIRGVGLGLSISASILREHRGEIRVESTLHQGSTFFIDLPLASHQPQAPSTASPPAEQDLTGKRVLILDDDRAIRKIYAQTLRLEGFKAKTTANGFTALRWLQQGDYDLVLLDLKMPIMDGADFLDQLCQVPDEVRPLIVVVSGLSPNNQPNLDQYPLAIPPLQKPMPLIELGDAIRQAFAQG